MFILFIYRSLVATGGLFILLLAAGFFLHIILTMGVAMINWSIKSSLTTENLGMVSTSFLLSILTFITISILAIFIP